MPLLKLALNVINVNESVKFYQNLLAVPPQKQRPGYAEFVVPGVKLLLIENSQAYSSLNHLGIEVADPTELQKQSDRLQQAVLELESHHQITCCYSIQDKIVLHDPDGASWEICVNLGDASEFGEGRPASQSLIESSPCCLDSK